MKTSPEQKHLKTSLETPLTPAGPMCTDLVLELTSANGANLELFSINTEVLGNPQ